MLYLVQKYRGILLALLLLAFLLSACSVIPLDAAPSAEPLEGEHAPGPIVQAEELIIAMLFISAVVSLASDRLRIPYTVGLVLVGFALTFLGSIPALVVTPELILALLVPPLIYEAAFHLNFADLRKDLRLVLTLAIPGVVLTTLLVGGLVSWGSGIALPYALVFGALIAATDPVSVIALFRSLGAPVRLRVLVEGESLLNDGTAIVLFNLMLAIALTGQANLGRSFVEFFIVAGGGLVVGAAAGVLVSQMISKIDNYLVETALTTVLAYGSYLIAEYMLGVSGVLAVVAAGLAAGQIGPRGMSPTTRIVLNSFWEFAGFLANSFVFLIIGLEMNLELLLENLVPIGWAILAVLAARAVVVYGLAALRRDLPVRWKNILYWGGLRGAISLALALSLPIDLPNRTQLQAMAFGVVLFTLVVNGLSMQQLMKLSKVIGISTAERAFERSQGRAAALRAARARIQRLNHEGTITDYTTRILTPLLEHQIGQQIDEMHEALDTEPSLRQEELVDAWREGLRAQRSALTALFRDNFISEETYSELVADVDALLANPEQTWPELESQLRQLRESEAEGG